MKVDGRCHFGRITYEAVAETTMAGICHCSDCQMLTGSVYRVTVQVASETFVLLSGQPKTYVKTADSGNRRVHAFCPDCGTPVYAAAVENPPTYSLRLGCLAQRHQFRPVRQQWCKSALPWAMNLESIDRRDQQ